MQIVTAVILGQQCHHVERLREVLWMRPQGSLLRLPPEGVWDQLWVEHAQPLVRPQLAFPQVQ